MPDLKPTAPTVPPTDLPDGLAARQGALRLMAHVLRDGRMLGDGASGLTGPVAARALRLAGLTLRHMGRADTMVSPRMERQPAARARDILRLALAELFEDAQAPYGVVNDAVALARMSPRTAKQAGLVNAVLRGLTDDMAARKAEWDALPAPTLPPWLRTPVAKAFGRDRLEAIEAAHLRGAPLDLTPKPGVTVEGAETLPTGSWRLPGGQVSTLPGYEAGDWWVQDAAAAIPVRLLGDVTGLRVLDLCAAPGGKTMQLAAGGARVTALDISDARLRRVRANLERTGLAAEIVTADAFDWTPPDGTAFDIVILDAPCTATGTIRRHPDLPHLREARDVEALTTLQYRLLDRALDLVRPGGRVLYCTCSLLPVEGEHQVTAALKRHPGLTAQAPEPGAFGLPDIAASPHGIRLLPDLWPERGGMDGFYMAVLYRPETAGPGTEGSETAGPGTDANVADVSAAAERRPDGSRPDEASREAPVTDRSEPDRSEPDVSPARRPEPGSVERSENGPPAGGIGAADAVASRPLADGRNGDPPAIAETGPSGADETGADAGMPDSPGTTGRNENAPEPERPGRRQADPGLTGTAPPEPSGPVPDPSGPDGAP